MTQNRFIVGEVEPKKSRFIVGEVDGVEATPERQKKGFFQSISDAFTGEGRMTPEMEGVPTIMESGFLAGQPMSTVAKVAPMVALTNDPMEIAQIIQSNVPGVRMMTNKDAQGKIYPILVNEEGETALVDRPGLDLMNLGQFATQTAAFMTGGGAGSIPGAIAKDVAIESAIQGAQAATGGEFDTGDVVTAGALAGGGKLLEDAVGAGAKALFGKADEAAESLVKSGVDFDVPVTTSDIYNPQNWATRSLQFTGESVPVIGTGKLRTMQQEAREQAVDQFINLHRGGSYEEIIQEIGKRNARLKDAAGTVYSKINPQLDNLSKELGGVPNDQSVRALGELGEFITQPGRSVDDSIISLLDDMESIFKNPQDYQLLRDNITTWQSKIDSIDPAFRSQMAGPIKAKFQSVLKAARKDRDAFAQNALDPREYAKLKQADSLYGEISENLKGTKIKTILDKGDVTPEIASQMLYSNKPSEIRRLYDNLTTGGKENARSVIVGDIVEKLSKRAGGQVTPTTFINELRKNQPTIDVFFKGKEKEQLNGLMKLIDSTRRAQDVAKGAGSQTAERMLAGGAVGAGFFEPSILAGYGSIGALSSIYESPAVRNVLIKINGTAPGSPEFKRLAKQASELFRAGAQATPQKGQSETEQQISEESRRTARALQ